MRAMLLTYGLMACALIACDGKTAGDSAAPEPDAPETHQAQSTALVLQCDGLAFVAELSERGATLFLPDETLLLPQVESASGAKYQREGVVFWSQGQQASLEYQGEHYAACRNNPAQAVWETAKLRGVDFRAVGNEPGWSLDIQGSTLSLQTDYGMTKHLFHDASIDSDQASSTTQYRAQNDEASIGVTLEGDSCSDTMADASYPTSVTIELEGRVLRGCGRALH